MKKSIIYFSIITLFLFIFIIFYRGLDKSVSYEPESKIKNIPEFSAITFFQKQEINSKNIFDKNKFYLVNIWASWCVPCRDEHSFLVNLSKNDQLEIIGLNYKDSLKNAEKFLNELGNPYKKILIDKDGTKAIEWGAFGVPETFLVFENKIIKKFIGPLNIKSFAEIKKIIQ
jgi:cytochrome c biogenesis protein CcmG/thiol:disulfide interchange protein DsbE|tara:strand:- start:145 stop:660 length:516 start_codon:yes stop_codon:yes gene_type:complete